MKRRKNTSIKIKLFIDSLAPGGDGTARYEDKICFIEQGVPGDTVEVSVFKQDRKNMWAAIDSIIKESPHRRKPFCPVADRCGGCSWQHINFKEQTAQKIKTVERMFGLDGVPFVSTQDEVNYRRLARLHFEKKGRGAARIGFFGKRGHKIVDIDHCPVLEKELSDIIVPIKKGLLTTLEGWGEVLLSRGVDGVWLYFKSSAWLPTEFYDEARKLVPDVVKGVVCEVDGIVSLVAGTADVPVRLAAGKNLRMPAGSFGQANSQINDQMILTLTKWIGSLEPVKKCVELFSGAGNFTVSIAPLVKKVESVELDKRACDAAKINLKEYNISNVRVYPDDAASAIDKLATGADLVVLDPPRTGNSILANKLSAGEAHTIIYISCNPGTLKRDIKILNDGGYTLKSLVGFDMFPQTPHIELMALLSR